MAAQTILIAEDDPDIRDGVRILLAGEGYHILEAENGTRALEIFNPEVDLVILDIMMPGSRPCCGGTASIRAKGRWLPSPKT